MRRPYKKSVPKKTAHHGYAVGQRWISEMEPELGLGHLTKVDSRTIHIHFAISECSRQYAMTSAPLKRVHFYPGERITLKNQNTSVVQSVSEKDELIYYHITDDAGIIQVISETELADSLIFTTPKERLNAGFSDSPELFDLRYQAHAARYRYQKSDVTGFTGARVALIPHQFYIAGEVASRHRHRVMLADETGLGKTIEACLILNRLLLTERIERVLILVPHSLVHQWFVELYRRFHLTFRIMDDEHWHALKSRDKSVNPFADDQLFICDMEWVVSNRKRGLSAIEAGWDIVVVDEAHHVDEDAPHYHFLNQLSERGTVKNGGRTPTGLMLLTATPEQLGEERHFAHLKLLDPTRYTTLDQYRKESEDYKKLAESLETSMANTQVSIGERSHRVPRRSKTATAADKSDNSLSGIQQVLDCYGPGRAVFRNTRKVIQGFPKRHGILYPLDEKNEKEQGDDKQIVQTVLANGVTPERIQWLATLLKQFPDEKFLLICHTADGTVEIADALKQKITLTVTLFNEKMTILQRDRSAAWFSEPAEKNGAQLMICSEIGSEGRNFQFASHLILFDLPLNPELLEQRIGRLDRIGQTQDIQIHLPYQKDSAQDILANWYDGGTGIFHQNINGIHAIFNAFEPQLKAMFAHRDHDSKCLDVSGIDSVTETDRPSEKRSAGKNNRRAVQLKSLIDETKAFSKKVTENLAQGKDKLLELNSYRPGPATALINTIRKIDDDTEFDGFVLRLLDYYGIQIEDTLPRSYRLYLTDPDNSEIPLPTLKKNGLHITFDRGRAVTRDDMEFLSWDHPMVSGSTDLLLGSEYGNCSMVEFEGEGGAAVLLEAIHVLECVAPKGLNMNRFLPSTPVRVVVNHEMDDVTKEFMTFQGCTASKWLEAFPEIKKTVLPDMIETSIRYAERHSSQFIERAKSEIIETVGGEGRRLIELQKKNPAITDDEITYAKEETKAYLKYLTTARLRLDAIRLIKVE